MKIKTSEMTGAALDWAVAKCEGHSVYFDEGVVCLKGRPFDGNGHYWLPTQNWDQGGPIIERERISVVSDFHEIKKSWIAENYQGNIQQFGPTPLIAAMRCYVMSRFGDEIEIPQELFE